MNLAFLLSFATFVVAILSRVFMRKFCLILLLGIVVNIASASVADDAAALFNERRYREASELYVKLLNQNPNSALYHYRYARCLYELGEYESSIHHFHLSGERYALRNYYMGLLHELTYRFSEAVTFYENYAEGLEEEESKRTAVLERIDYCRHMERYLQRVEDIVITDSAIVDADVFLSAYHLSNDAGSLTQENGGVCYTNQRNDRKFFSLTHSDSVALYSSEKLLDQWTEAHRIGFPINQGNCSYPYIMSDGVTMYFASTNNSMGGYDIFITRYNHTSDGYMTPENIGMPFNSPANDYMMAIDENQGIGWWATDRRQEEGKVAIYTFIYQEEKQYISPSDSLLREKAQLLVYATEKQDKKPLVETEVNNVVVDSTHFSFIINPQTTYTSLSDFESQEALTLFQEYKQTQDSIRIMECYLAELRQQYRNASPATKQPLSHKIIDLEQQIPIVKQYLRRLTLLIREEENKVINIE